MSGSGQLTVPHSEIPLATPLTAGQIIRGIPTLASGAPTNVADCRNLVADSPPTLLELYEIYAFSIAVSGFVNSSGAWNPLPILTLELALLVNDQVFYTTSQQQQAFTVISENLASGGTINADLVNPIRVGARDRLSLRLGLTTNETADEGGLAGVGVLASPAGGSGINYLPSASTISYNVLDMPASRRL